MGIFSRKHHADTRNPSAPVLKCSFCYKDGGSVRKLIAGPTVFICNECIEICNDIIADDARHAAFVAGGQPASERAEAPVSERVVECALCRMPGLTSDGLLIQSRGWLCFGCVGAIEAAIGESRP